MKMTALLNVNKKCTTDSNKCTFKVFKLRHHENGDFIKKNKCQVGGGRWGKGRMDGGKLSPRGSWTDVGFVSSILKLLTPFIHQ